MQIYISQEGGVDILWFGELMDLKVCGETQDLYIRMPAALLKDEGVTVSQSGFNKKIRVFTITLSILLVLLGVSLATYVYNMKIERSYTKGRRRRVHNFGERYSNVEKEDLELNFISLSEVVKATNNFSIDNKLGEGGFGPVYKVTSCMHIKNEGSGCLLWFGELMDLRVSEESQYIFIRMSASLLKDEVIMVSQSGFNKKIRVMIITMSVLLVLLGVSLAAYVCNMKTKRSYMKGRGRQVQALDKKYSDVEKDDLDLNFISLSKIVKATNNFSIDNKLGEGGFGPVYKGVLESGQEIAVKQLSKTSEQGYDEFYNEVVCVARLQHRNLVELLGYCMDGDERILIYEYMSNKSLDLYLFDETKCCMLEWPLRFDIIHGIAKGILYLHQDSRHRIIHRDLKASNILLDHHMNPKISDFGLAREFGGDQVTAKTKKVVGTYGYISPEYAIHGHISVKSDVFSFGVLVVEIVSGMRNKEFSCEDVNDNLLGHAWRLYSQGKCLELMSPSLRNSCIVSEVERTIHVGLLCVQNLAQDRPTMSPVVTMLSGEGALHPPKQPAFFVGEGLPNPNPFLATVDEGTITTLEPR